MKVKIDLSVTVTRDIPDSYFMKDPEYDDNLEDFSPYILSCPFIEFKEMCVEKENKMIKKNNSYLVYDCYRVCDLKDNLIAEG